jgi:hypothetical protein
MAPKITEPSGRTTGEDEPKSNTSAEPGALVVGSTPRVAPTRQALGVEFVGPIGTSTPHPSLSSCCIEAAHFGPEKSDFTATR